MTNKDILCEVTSNIVNDASAMMHSIKTVECKLRKTYERIAATEADIHLFINLKQSNLATNDIMNFIKKQTIHKRILTKPDLKLLQTAMKSKLSDALSFAKRQRQARDKLKKRLSRLYGDDKTSLRRVLDGLYKHYKDIKCSEMLVAKNKINHLREKEQFNVCMRQAPTETSEFLAGVNIFTSDQLNVKPEPPTKHFICDQSIKFTGQELKLLARGPKFMVRED